MTELEQTLPKGFRRLFSSKRAFYYIDCLIAIYDTLEKKTHVSNGLMKTECKYAISKVPMDVEEDEEDVVEPDDKEYGPILNFLVKTGWLTNKFNDVEDEYKILIPSFTQELIKSFKNIKNIFQSNGSSMSDIYAQISTYQRVSRSDNEFLRTALLRSRELNSSLKSSVQAIEVYLRSLMNKEDGGELLNELLERLQASKDGASKANTDESRFYTYQANTLHVLEKLISDTLENINEIQQLQDDLTLSEYDTYETMLDAENDNLEMLKGVEKEVRESEILFRELISQYTEMTKRAYQKYIYLQSNNSKDSASRLLQLISALAIKEKQGDDSLLERTQEVLTYNWEPECYLSHDIYLPAKRDASTNEIFLIPDESEDVEDIDFNQKYSREELRTFINERSFGGRFSATGENIKNEKDLDMLVHSMLSIVGDLDIVETSDFGSYISVKDGLGFNRVEWDTEE